MRNDCKLNVRPTETLSELVDPEAADYYTIAFDVALEALRERISRLSTAIHQMDHHETRRQQCDVRRSIERTKTRVHEIAERLLQENAARRLDEVISIAERVLACTRPQRSVDK
jgi:acetate kinase